MKSNCIVCRKNNKVIKLTNGICSINLCEHCGQKDIEVSRNNWYHLYEHLHELGFKHKGKTFCHEIDDRSMWLSLFKKKYKNEIGFKYRPIVKVELNKENKKVAKRLSGKAIAERVVKIKGFNYGLG